MLPNDIEVQEKLNQVISVGLTPLWRTYETVQLVSKAYSEMATSVSATVTPIEKAGLALGWYQNLARDTMFSRQFVESTVSMSDSVQAFSDKASSVVETIQNAWGQLYSHLSGIASQYQKNQEIRLNNEYKKRLDIIKKTIKNEEEQQKAIMALDAEYDIKRQAINRRAARQAKATALMEAIVNTASGVARALKDYPWPFNAIVGAIVAALGAVQIRLITSQPLPLAKGAVFEKPTEFFTPAGGRYLVGEAGTEILLPERRLRDIVREEMGGGGSLSIQMPIEIQLGQTTIKREVVAIINRAAARGELKLPAERVLA